MAATAHVCVNVYGINGFAFGTGTANPTATYGKMSFPTGQVRFENADIVVNSTHCYGSIVDPRAEGPSSSYNPALQGARYHVIETATALATLAG